MKIREEIMSPAMTKFHVEGLPFGCVFHRFTEPDRGDPHDHPWAFNSRVRRGRYVEEIFSKTGRIQTVLRESGYIFTVPINRVHRIIELPDGECWTEIEPLPHLGTQKSGFWKFREDGAYHRFWDQHGWTKR